MSAAASNGHSVSQRSAETDRAALFSIREAAQSGDFKRAAALATAALANGLEHPSLLNLVALELENEGRIDEALSHLRRAVALAPGDIGARNALGLCLNRESPEEALEHFDAALSIDPTFSPAYFNRGSAFDAMGVLDKAEADYRRALALDPDNIGAKNGVASILARKGAYAEARMLAGEVVARIPGFPDATMTLAAADLGEGLAVSAEERLRALLGDPRTAPLERALAKGWLGDALDAQARIAEAFETYRQGNEERQSHYAGHFAGKAGALETLRWMTQVLERQKCRPVSAPLMDAPHPASGHVFLLGFPRSGTTLVEQVLAGHPRVETLEERESLIDAVRAFLRGPAEMEQLFSADGADLARFCDLYWRRVADAGARVEGKIFIDKHPLNTLKLPLIARLFPKAKVLFALRDPRDVVLSCFRRRFRMSAPYYQMLTLDGAARLYDAAMRAAEAAMTLAPMDVHQVRHEELVADFDAEVKAICAFIGVDWNDTLRAFAARIRDRSVSTPSGAQLARGLSDGGVGYWRRYRTHMAPVLPVLEPWVRHYSYGGEDHE